MLSIRYLCRCSLKGGTTLLFSIFTFLGNAQTIIAQQDFEGGAHNWDYSTNVPFFDNVWGGDGRFDLVSSGTWNGDLNYDSLSGNILGINDLYDENENGTQGQLVILFEQVNVSGYDSVKVLFDFESRGFSGNDYVKVELFEDEISKGLSNIAVGIDTSETWVINTSPAINAIDLLFRIRQDALSAFIGLDNIKLEGIPKSDVEPSFQPSTFQPLTYGNNQITLSWTDPSTGIQLPHGYLIQAADTQDFAIPGDGIDPLLDRDLSDGNATVKVGYGIEEYTFENLQSSTPYYFQIWSFTNAASNINFLTANAPGACDTILKKVVFYSESFESPSGFNFPNGNGNNNEDFFDRTNITGAPLTSKYAYYGFDGNYFIAGEDIDGILTIDSGIVQIDSIKISDHFNIELTGSFASGSQSGIEAMDMIKIEVKLDKGNWKTIGQFNGKAGRFAEDTDLNGTGDGDSLNGEFKDFTWSVPGSGEWMAVKITMTLNTGGEEAAFDDIRIGGKPYKKWDFEAVPDSNWSNAENWHPDGVPETDDRVILDNSKLNANYLVMIDSGLNSKKIHFLQITPDSGRSIKVIRSKYLNDFELTGNSDALIIESGGEYIDQHSDGVPKNFLSNKGQILIREGGSYKVYNQNSFSTSDLVDAISVNSSPKGTVTLQSTGQIISASGKTYPTSLTLKKHSDITGSITYKTTYSSNFTIEGDLTIDSNVVYLGDTMGGDERTGDLTLKGNLINNGSFKLNENQQILILEGDSAQSIQGVSSLSKVEINNTDTSAIQLQEGLTIRDQLSLSKGYLDIGDNDLILKESVIIAGGSNHSYIRTSGNGSLVFEGIDTGTTIFPIGVNPYLPVEISCNDCISDTFEVNVREGVFENPEEEIQAITSGVVGYTWDIMPYDSVSDIDVEFQWHSSAENSLSHSNTLIGKWVEGNSTFWNTEAITVNGNDPYFAEKDGIALNSNINYFIISDQSNPLPVELMYFDAWKMEDWVKLTWGTASEVDNSHFTIQRKNKGDWKNIGKVNGIGTSVETNHYEFIDERPLQGSNYYRLRQVDFDGTYSIFEIRHIYFEADQILKLIHTENGRAPYLRMNLDNGEKVLNLKLMTVKGRIVTEKAQFLKSGENSIEIPDWQKLNQGFYILEIRLGELFAIEKLYKFR